MNNVEDKITEHFAGIASQIEPGHRLDDVISEDPAMRFDSPQRRLSPLKSILAAAAVVGITVAGLAVATRDRQEPETPAVAQQSDASAVLSPTGLTGAQFSVATDLVSADWVVASVLPDEVEWLYPLAAPRVVSYGSRSEDGVSSQLQIAVGDRSALDGAPVEIAGTAWTVNTDNPRQWEATRELPSTVVTVTGAGDFEQIDRDLIGALLVVPESALPSPPLGDPAREVEVARFDVDETSYTLFAQASNGFWCNVLRTSADEGENDEESGSGGCGVTLESTIPLTVGGGETSTGPGASTSRAARAGSVTADAVRVDVEFIDGTLYRSHPSTSANSSTESSGSPQPTSAPIRKQDCPPPPKPSPRSAPTTTTTNSSPPPPPRSTKRSHNKTSSTESMKSR